MRFALLLFIPGCVDLFHGTDFRNACVGDASSCISDAAHVDVAPPEGGDTPTPIMACTTNVAEARRLSERTCAWLGACENPSLLYGECVYRAMTFADCEAAPSFAPLGRARGLWNCLFQAKTCREIRACTGGVRPLCPSDGYSVCSETDDLIRYVCHDAGAPPSVEPCALSATRCRGDGSRLHDTCGGTNPLVCSSGCEGKRRRHCDDDGERFEECELFGAAQCMEGDGGARCAPASDAGCDGAPLSCVGDVAQACERGVASRVHCARLLGRTGTCRVDAGMDPMGACGAVAECTPDSCSPPASCYRGVPFPLACDVHGLGPCRLVKIPGSASPHAACSPPNE